MRERNFKIFTNGDMSESIASAAICIRKVQGWAAQAVFTGAPVGTLAFSVSCDPSFNPDGSAYTPTIFTVYGSSEKSVTTAGSEMWNVNLANYNWIKFNYTYISGTGVLNGRMNIKGI